MKNLNIFSPRTPSENRLYERNMSKMHKDCVLTCYLRHFFILLSQHLETPLKESSLQHLSSHHLNRLRSTSPVTRPLPPSPEIPQAPHPQTIARRGRSVQR